MCGIFGWHPRGTGGRDTGNKGLKDRPSLKRLTQIAKAIEHRGPHAFGYAWIDQNGELQSYKQAGSITQSRETLGMLLDSRGFIAHVRWATVGDPEDATNNHPFEYARAGTPAQKHQQGYLIHNGTITGHQRLSQWLEGKFGIERRSVCDSELLARVIEITTETQQARQLLDAVKLARLHSIKLPMAAALIERDRIVFARAGKPLFFGTAQRGGHYFSSVLAGLPMAAQSVPNGSVQSIFSHTSNHGGSQGKSVRITRLKNAINVSSDRRDLINY